MPVNKKKYCFLVVEDNPGDFVIVEEYLVEQFLSPIIVPAVTFAQASAILMESGTFFDAIVLDLSLPDKNGAELIADILKVASGYPIIILTGYSDVDFSIMSIAQGISDYLIKDEMSGLMLRKSIIYAISRKKAEKKLKATNDRLLLAAKSAGMGIWDWDIIQDKLSWDGSMHKIYKIDQEYFGSIYEGWISRLHPEDKAQIHNEMQMAINGFKEYDTEFRIVWPDSTIRFIKATGIVEKNEYGEAVRIVGLNWDVTDQKNEEIMKEKITSDIVQRNKDLEQFSYIISHNLRAPVANILGLTNLMVEPQQIDDKNREMMMALSNSVKKLDSVITDLNYILRLKQEVSENKELVNFSELVQDIIISIQTMVEKEKAEVTTDFLAVDELFSIKSYLYSIFYNLISNSIKYRRTGVAPRIDIRSVKKGNHIQLIFKDNGLGIDLNKRGDQVFGLYKRFHNHVEGKGMGLYMVKTQVETLGGTITLKSEINNGSEFTIEFEEDNR